MATSIQEAFHDDTTVNGTSYHRQEAPYVKNRGVKYNVPFDLRIPTYHGYRTHPMDELPAYIRKINDWGQRADFAHDGKRILFIEKTYGDAFELDLGSGKVTPVTHHSQQHDQRPLPPGHPSHAGHQEVTPHRRKLMTTFRSTRIVLGGRQIRRYPLLAPRSGSSEGEGRVRVVNPYLPLALAVCFTISLTESAANCVAAEKPFIHPGILHSRAELDFVKAKVAEGQEPWKAAWEELRRHAISELDWRPEPVANVVRGVRNRPDIGGTNLMRDGAAAYSHAIQWYVTGEQPHANKAIEILKTYATTLKSIGGHDARLLAGMAGISFANAAEILRHTQAPWSGPDQKQFERLLREVFYAVIEDFYPTANGNWDAAMIQTMLAMGVFLDDREMFQRAVDYTMSDNGNGAIGKYFNDFGECQESGRDQAHTQMGLGYLGCAAEIAWKQGVDLYGTLDHRLALGFEYTAKYNLGHEVPYEPYRSHEGRYNYPRISDKSRGRFSSIYERVYHHYHDRMGLEMPFTAQAIEKIRPERWQSSHASWGTLTHAGQPAN